MTLPEQLDNARFRHGSPDWLAVVFGCSHQNITLAESRGLLRKARRRGPGVQLKRRTSASSCEGCLWDRFFTEAPVRPTSRRRPRRDAWRRLGRSLDAAQDAGHITSADPTAHGAGVRCTVPIRALIAHVSHLFLIAIAGLTVLSRVGSMAAACWPSVGAPAAPAGAGRSGTLAASHGDISRFDCRADCASKNSRATSLAGSPR